MIIYESLGDGAYHAEPVLAVRRGRRSLTMYSLRPATAHDFELLHALRAACYRSYVEQLYGEWNDQWQRDRLRKKYPYERFDIIVVDERDVGYVEVVWSELLHINNIVIQPDRQGRGLGSQVLQDLLQQADDRHTKSELRVLKSNPARRLYERLGFRVCGETEQHHYMERAAPSR